MHEENKDYLIDRIVIPVQRFIHHEKSGGIVLGISVIIALLLANSPWSEFYFDFLGQKSGFTFHGTTYLEYDIHHWINDGLMAMFFFVVGLELKREIISGELSNIRKAFLPIGAAIGGMVVPALIYISLNNVTPMSRGWGIPMATDIAFALAVLYLLGSKIPLSLKVFLTALAIVDDLGAVLVIAFFYTSDISLLNLFIGLGFVLIMFIANKSGVRNILFYALLGIGGVWVAFLLSGVHATIAAVLAAFVIPADVVLEENTYIKKIQNHLHQFKIADTTDSDTLTNEQLHILNRIKTETNAAIPPSQRLENSMHPLITFIILPVFALANAGISFKGIELDNIFSTNVFTGVSLGLLVGKVVGIVGMTLLLVKLKIAAFSEGMNIRTLIGLGLLASIGFTMSLFITSLAFADELHILQAKLGIFTASLIGGIAGYLVLNKKNNK